MDGLTPKQQAFADYYIETGNATEAARRAGYKGANLNRVASENLSKLDIQQYINGRMAEKDSQRIASQDEILEYLTRVVRGAEVEEVVSFGPDGPVKTTRQAAVRDRNKAAELLGKRYATWVDRQLSEGHQTVQIIEDIGHSDGLDDTIEMGDDE